MRRTCFTFLFLFLGFSGCTTLHFAPSPRGQESPSEPQALLYDQIYPLSIEFCALSRLNPVEGKRGGSGGHAVMYLTGACLDKKAGYPRLETCDGSGQGTGISVDKMFKNVNWMGVQDKTLFFGTGLPEETPVTPELIRDTAELALKQGYFKGIQLHEKWMEEKPVDQDDQIFIAEKTLGTDYALAYSRYAECVKIPVTEAMMNRIIEFLNEQNARYFKDETYVWSNWSNNCTHLLHNALAAAGIVKPKKTGASFPRMLFNFAIPSNEALNLTEMSLEDLPEDEASMMKKESLALTFEEYGWLPMQAGVLLRKIPLHANNEVHRAHSEVLMLDWPFLNLKAGKFERLLNDPVRTDLIENAKWFQARYDEALADSTDGTRYRTYLKEKRRQTESLLKASRPS